jgi:hypothetical protein
LDADTILAWAKILLSGAITATLVPLALYFARYYWDRRRWHTFEGLIRAWAQAEFALDELTNRDWNALVAMKLSDAGFEPTKIKEFLEFAVWFAQGRASQDAFDRIGFRQKDEADGNPDESN